MIQTNLSIVWFSVEDAIPFPGKKVLVSDGETVSVSTIEMVEMRYHGSSALEVHWKGGINVAKWALIPEAPGSDPEVPTQSGPSVW